MPARRRVWESARGRALGPTRFVIAVVRAALAGIAAVVFRARPRAGSSADRPRGSFAGTGSPSCAGRLLEE